MLTFPPFNLKKKNTNMEPLQPAKQNDMVANNNDYKVSKNKHTTDEDKNKQLHSQIKIHPRNIT